MRRPPQPPSHTRADRLGVGLLGCLLLASAALSAELALDHMARLGVICGPGHDAHCGWCYGAVGFALAGLTALILSGGPDFRRMGLLQIKTRSDRT